MVRQTASLVYLSVMLLGYANICSSETIGLKNGKKYEGNIIDRTDEYVRIQTADDLVRIPFNMMDNSSREAVSLIPVFQAEVEKGEQESSQKLSETDNDYDEDLLKEGILFPVFAGLEKEKGQDFYAEGAVNTYSFILHRKAVISLLSPMPCSVQDFEDTRESLREQQTMQVLADEKINFLGEPCYVLTFLQHSADEIPWKHKNYFFYKNGKAYSITFSAAEEDFNKYAPEFEGILSGFGVADDSSPEDFQPIDRCLQAAFRHARNYPPDFDSKIQRENLEKELLDVIARLEHMLAGTAERQPILLRLGKANTFAYNLDIPGSREKADKFFAELFQLVPDHAEGHLFYGQHLSGRGEFKSAIEHLQIAADAGFDMAFTMMGLAYIQMGHEEEARKAFQQFQARHPEDPQVQMLLDALDPSGAYEFKSMRE